VLNKPELGPVDAAAPQRLASTSKITGKTVISHYNLSRQPLPSNLPFLLAGAKYPGRGRPGQCSADPRALSGDHYHPDGRGGNI
jgi:hypothetical protein